MSFMSKPALSADFAVARGTILVRLICPHHQFNTLETVPQEKKRQTELLLS